MRKPKELVLCDGVTYTTSEMKRLFPKIKPEYISYCFSYNKIDKLNDILLGTYENPMTKVNWPTGEVITRKELNKRYDTNNTRVNSFIRELGVEKAFTKLETGRYKRKKRETFDWFGEQLNVTQIAEKAGVNRTMLYHRIDRHRFHKALSMFKEDYINGTD